MQLFKAKDYLRSWSTWVLGAVTVTPALDAIIQPIADLLPESWKPWFISGLGIIGLVVRAIKQK